MTDALRTTIANELRMAPPPVMEGWTEPDRGIELAQLVLDTQPEVVVEIGVFGGRSLIALGLAVKENGHGHVYGIDPWKKEISLEGETNQSGFDWWTACPLEEVHQKAMKAIWDNKLDEWVTVIRSAGQHCNQLWKQGEIDWLTIDGNHAEPIALRDVQTYVPKVKPGGLIYFDDSDWESTQKAVAELMTMTDLVKDGGKYRVCRKK